MKILKFRFESVSPLLQHDDKMANPFNDYTKRMKAISSKRKKTDDDLMEWPGSSGWQVCTTPREKAIT